MKIIKLLHNKETVVDDDVYEWASKIPLHVNDWGYVIYNWRKPNNKRTKKALHRVIINAPPGIQVDHIDGNTLNNLRSNLRLCDSTGNNRNSRHQKSRKGVPTSSKYKGVSFDGKKWVARIQINGKNTYLGRFINEIDAAKKYDEYAIKYYEEFAKPNFIKEI